MRFIMGIPTALTIMDAPHRRPTTMLIPDTTTPALRRHPATIMDMRTHRRILLLRTAIGVLLLLTWPIPSSMRHRGGMMPTAREDTIRILVRLLHTSHAWGPKMHRSILVLLETVELKRTSTSFSSSTRPLLLGIDRRNQDSGKMQEFKPL